MLPLIAKIIDVTGQILYFPASFLSPFWQMVYCVAISTVIAMLIYKVVSNPKTITLAKDRIKGSILEMRLYKDSAKALLLAFLKSLLYTVKYFAHNLVPVVVILPVLFPIFPRMDAAFGYRPVRENESFIVQLKMAGDLERYNVDLREGEFYEKAMPRVNVRSLNEINWKLRARKPGVWKLEFDINGKNYSKELVIAEMKPINPYKPGPENAALLLYPLEGTFPRDSGIREIAVLYEMQDFRFLFFNWHWIITYLILVIVLALLTKKWFKVEF